MKELESIPIVQSTTNKIARSMATEESSVMDDIQTFCNLCNALRKQDSLNILNRNGRSNL